MRHTLASDNASGVHPDVMDALLGANEGHQISYGSDPVTERAIARLKQIFGTDTEVFFALTGTGANVLSLSAVVPSYGAIVCTDCSHINTDECGAPERAIGCKLLPVASHSGKLSADSIAAFSAAAGVQHHNQPAVVSITQATELGTLYSADEVREISAACKASGLLLHMDGARFANACAGLGMGLREASKDLGVDILSLGATKNGAMFAEAVIVFSGRIDTGPMQYLRKQHMQLTSKMRFASAQFDALFSGDLWSRNATHANEMAQRLADRVSRIPGVEIMHPVQANGVFARIPEAVVDSARELQYFYVWNPDGPVVRWMTSFDTTAEIIDEFADGLRRIVDEMEQ